MLQGPSRFNPYKNPEAANIRTVTALNAMKNAGHITQQQYDEAVKEPFQLLDVNTDPPKSTPCAHVFPIFREAVKKDFLEMNGSKSNDNIPITLEGQGIDVDCTINLRLQELAQQCLQKGIMDQERIHRKHGAEWGMPGGKSINRSSPAQLEDGADYDAKITSDLNEENKTIRVTIPGVKGGEKEFILPVDPEKTWLSKFDLLHPGYYIRCKGHQSQR